MLKGVGWYTIFIITVIGMFVGAMLVMFWNYIEVQKKEVSREACLLKLQNYCYRWVTEKKEPGDWDNIHPKEGCEKFNINRPTQKDCENIFGVKIS
jgi:hypothetical protein